MKEKIKFVDEISEREFDTKEEALKSENKNIGIAKLFSFWKFAEDEHCRFSNGEFCYQRTKKEYEQFKEALFIAIKSYEPWIAKQYEDYGGLSQEHMTGFIGRYLDDAGSELYSKYGVLSNICPICYREWGQKYYAIHCSHNETKTVKI